MEKHYRGAGAAPISLLLAFVPTTGCVSTQPTKEVRPKNPLARTADAIDSDITWATPEGSGPDRLRLNRAVWKHDGHDMLVVLEYGQALFGKQYTVLVLDKARHMVRRGNIYADNGDQPYGLVEIRSNDPSLPAPYRDRWILAVEIWPNKEEYDPALPTIPAPRLVSTSPPNTVIAEPVEWDDEPTKFSIKVGRLANVDQIECRAAEPSGQAAKRRTSQGPG